MPRIEVTFPSGAVRTVYLIQLLAQAQNAEMQAKFGMSLARNAPTLKSLREFYEWPPSVRTWAQAAPLLRKFHADLSAHYAACTA